jgi:3-hydroxyacyl-CoA dehydrogenase
MFVFKAAVVGGGKSGGEIVHAIANAGIPVVLEDGRRGGAEQALAVADALWRGQVEAGKLEAAEAQRRAGLIVPSSGYEGFGDVDFVIETLSDQLEVKQQAFAELDEVTPGHAILAADTAYLPVTEIADATARADKVVGFRFARPIPATRLVEVAEGEYTSPETTQVAVGFAQSIRRTPIRCGDALGFVAGRILVACVSEAWRAQQETGAGDEELDSAIAEAKALPMGAFRLADALGLDTVLALAERLNEAYGERFYVPDRLRELVDAGHLGVSTGRGFHEYR